MSESQIDITSAPPTSDLAIGLHSMNNSVESTNNTFYQCLLDNLPEGVVFIDQDCGIQKWNLGAQQLTGIGSVVMGRRLQPSLLKLKDLNRLPIADAHNPFERWVQAGESASDKFYVTGRSGRDAQIEFQYYPVQTPERRKQGGVILMRDTSVQVELQRQLNDLYAIATLDPLTQVANRAEFERILEEYVMTHRSVGLSCSIIVADIDFFKKINDKHGHHVGDQALIAFAGMLRQFVRPHDFVARYGGEEFVILCGHCNEAAAADRADEIRKSLEASPQPMLGNKPMTASFGVAELQADDDATSLFVRADHALLNAKSSGRNCVVKSSTLQEKEKKQLNRKPVDSICPDQWRRLNYRPTLVGEFGTPTILQMFVERVKSMALDFGAQITHASEKSLTIQVQAVNDDKPSNRGTMLVDIDVVDPSKSFFACRFPPETKLLVRVAMHPKKGFFSPRDHAGIAQSLMKKIRSFLQLNSDCELRASEFTEGDKDRYGVT